MASITCSYGVIDLIAYIYFLFDGVGEIRLDFFSKKKFYNTLEMTTPYSFVKHMSLAL
jgi:hypothetical protein